MAFIVDSCVVISALVPADRNHDAARAFFASVAERNDTLFCPATLIWDVAAVFSHPNKVPYGTEVSAVEGLSLNFVDVTADLFFDTQADTHLRMVGNELRLNRSSIRGPDHIFLSCALSKRLPLITWDNTVREQAARFGVAVLTPEEYMVGKNPGATAPVPTEHEVLAELQRRFPRDNE
jgi:predicted nucleic acid-binding protein